MSELPAALTAGVELLCLDAGNTVILVEHDMRVIAGSDWVIDMGPGAGDEGGRIVIAGTPQDINASTTSKTAAHLKRFLHYNEASAPGKPPQKLPIRH